MSESYESESSGGEDAAIRQAMSMALGAVPSGLFILTASFDERRMGLLVAWVQQACFEPPMVSIALRKGSSIMPLISDSRQFGLCQLGESNGKLRRKFTTQIDEAEDPFLGVALRKPKLSKLPIMEAANSYFECELACHIDVEGDHDLFVGHVVNAGFNGPFTPVIHTRDDGFKY